MYNLFKFLSKNSVIFLFILLEIIAIVLIVQNNKYHKAGFINGANFFTGTVNSFSKNLKIYFNLRNENEKLAFENAQLKNQRKTLEYILIPKLEKDSNALATILYDTLIVDTIDHFKYIPALVVSNSINKKYNYIYLDKGQKDSVVNDMGVVESHGVVGVVVNTTKNYSLVMPLINEKSKLSVKIKNQGYFGTLHWTSGDHRHIEISEIPNHVLLNKGDTIVTSGYSQIFPKNILIGFIEESKKETGSSFLKVKVRLSVNFSNLNYTYLTFNNEIESFKKLQIE